MALLALSTSALAWWWASRASLTGGRDSFEGLPPDAGFVLAADPSVLLTDAALPRLLHATRRSDLAELLGDLLPSRVRRLLAVGWPEENQAAAALWGSFDAEGFVARLASAEGLERQPAPGRWGREDFAAQLIDGGLLLGTPGGVARLHASLEAPPKSASTGALLPLLQRVDRGAPLAGAGLALGSRASPQQGAFSARLDHGLRLRAWIRGEPGLARRIRAGLATAAERLDGFGRLASGPLAGRATSLLGPLKEILSSLELQREGPGVALHAEAPSAGPDFLSDALVYGALRVLGPPGPAGSR